MIDKSFKQLENKFDKKIVTLYYGNLKKFYPAEDYHQDYYQKNLLKYLMYKKGVKEREVLKKEYGIKKIIFCCSNNFL